MNKGAKRTLDFTSKIWNAPNSVIGLVLGGVGYGVGYALYGLGISIYKPWITTGSNGLIFHNSGVMESRAGLTLGNVILAGNNITSTTMLHESKHTYHGQWLGVLYIPAHAIGMILSLISYPIPATRRQNYTQVHGRLKFMKGSPFSSKFY